MKNFIKNIFKLPALISSLGDKYFLAIDVPLTSKVSHSKWKDYLYETGNKEGMKILEIGSREVTGKSDARNKFSKATYVGFDYYPGENVDVVGDVHKLSSYFNEADKFDIIYSSACFEHFAMPWVVATEINKLLKVGDFIFIKTHFAFSSHERPWYFLHYTDMALKVLFPPAMGFECIEAGLCNPIVGRFSIFADRYPRLRPVKGLYCHVDFLGKKVREVNDFNWENLLINDVVGDTKYPEPKTYQA